MLPINKIQEWLNKEKELGSPFPDRVSLATCSKDCIPHNRIVVIRELSAEGVLFFTQQGTRKVEEIRQNPHASMTLWLPLQQRQVILDGTIKELTHQENEHFWNLLPRDRQLRFSAYAPSSGQVIPSLSILDKKMDDLDQQYKQMPIPLCPFYCGFRLIPEAIYFYTLGTTTFSEVSKYECTSQGWFQQLLSP